MKLSNLYKPVYQQTLNIGIKYSANNVVKQHFTTRHMYPNPYPRSIAETTYSKCYVPVSSSGRIFHAISVSSDVE